MSPVNIISDYLLNIYNFKLILRVQMSDSSDIF